MTKQKEIKKEWREPSRDERKEAEDTIQRCTAKIIGLYPFFGEVIYGARFIFDPKPVNGLCIDTMATDGHNYFVYSPFVNNELKEDRKVIFILMHEILHIIMKHHIRAEKHLKKMNSVTSMVWNYAGDYEINYHLVKMGVPNPYENNGVGLKAITEEDIEKKELMLLYDKKYADLPVEKIYDMLVEDYKEQMKEQANTDMLQPQIGDYVRKNNGGYGQVTSINSDGTYSIEDVSKDEINAYFNS